MNLLKLTNPLDTEFLSANDVLMLPQEGTLPSRSSIDVYPFLYSAPMDTVTGFDMAKAMLMNNEFAVVSRFISEQEIIHCIKELGTEPRLFFAIGFNDYEKFMNLWFDYRTKDIPVNLAIDVAHGDMTKAHDLASRLKANVNVNRIMSGSICTPEAAIRACEAGCTDLRIGVGPGAACTTRLMTGIGMPQLSAVYLIHKYLKQEGLRSWVNLIADGGIKEPGDAAKYLAAGADGVMMGSVFSKCREAAGWEDQDGKIIKSYRGQASADFQKSIYGKANHCPEGKASKPFYWNGETVASTIAKFHGGIASSCSYLGLRFSNDLKPEHVRFIKITSGAYHEGTAHGV